MHAIVVAHGDPPLRSGLDEAWPGWDHGVALVIAADGGAGSAAALGLKLDLVVGDADSLTEPDRAELSRTGVPTELVSPVKDESDTELAVRAALDRGAKRLTILGALGGPRLDHGLANIGLLALPELADRPSALVDATTRVTLLRATGEDGPTKRGLPGRVGNLVSLLPLGPGVEGVTTNGLAYPLRDEPLPLGPARGISNVRTSTDASVSIRRGLLLIVETRQEGAPQ